MDGWGAFECYICNVDDDRRKQRPILYVDDFTSISDVRRVMLTNRANIGEDGFASNGWFWERTSQPIGRGPRPMLFDDTPKASVIRSMSHLRSKSRYRALSFLSSFIFWYTMVPGVCFSVLDGQRVNQRPIRGVGSTDVNFLIFGYFEPKTIMCDFVLCAARLSKNSVWHQWVWSRPRIRLLCTWSNLHGTINDVELSSAFFL